jgi:hypothetical protein
MFSGETLWAFRLKQASAAGALARLLPVLDLGESRSINTPQGRLATVRYTNVTMLDGTNIQDLPLEEHVREFEFGAGDYQPEIEAGR